MPAIGGPESDFAVESVVLLFAEERSLEEGVGVEGTVGIAESVGSVGLVSLGFVRSEGLLLETGATGYSKWLVSSLSASSSVVSDTDMLLGRDAGVPSSGDEMVGTVLADGWPEGCGGAGMSSGCGELPGRSLTRIWSTSSSPSLLGGPLSRLPALELSRPSPSSPSSPMLPQRISSFELSSTRPPLPPPLLSSPRPLPVSGTSRPSSSSSLIRPPALDSLPFRSLSCLASPSTSPPPPLPLFLTSSSSPPPRPPPSRPRPVSSLSSPPPPKNQLINEFGSSDPLPPKEAHGFPLLGASEVSQNGDMVHRARNYPLASPN